VGGREWSVPRARNRSSDKIAIAFTRRTETIKQNQHCSSILLLSRLGAESSSWERSLREDSKEKRGTRTVDQIPKRKEHHLEYCFLRKKKLGEW
jgi:hypothetical protein